MLVQAPLVGMRQTGRGPLLPFANVCSSDGSARRGRRCPARAHAVAVGAARPLHCAARSGVAPQNSLRSLRSLRSDNRGESVVDARWRAPTPALRCSSPPKSPPPGNACREARARWRTGRTPPRCLQRRERPGRRGRQEASAEQRSAAGSGRLRPKSACLWPCTQGRVGRLALRSEQRRVPPTPSGARLQPSPAWPLSPLPLQRSRNLERAQRTTVKGRDRALRASAHFMHRSRCEARQTT
jgi:hypothetical protein